MNGTIGNECLTLSRMNASLSLDSLRRKDSQLGLGFCLGHLNRETGARLG
jgi:hypothetical protein